ncbi:hypothetical protein LXM25_01255 [Dyadobacter sp. LJ53]|uniref:CIS tube protein n=1 Tax=Dyadobacter chenwenxiniae TaxID=2906456 RepID=UPI001F37D085|nr:hypothetical protein [Dyadobacter chenwenxiniae]MCF0048662.1 hypothetical protein [Dyadobacter chenwenxiniae]
MDAGEFGKKLLLNLKIIPIHPKYYFPLGLPFLTMFNPETLVIDEGVEYNRSCAPGQTNNKPRFKRITSRKFSLSFILDGTGVNAPKIPVTAQVLLFREATTLMNGVFHQPNCLLVQWGTFICRCKITTSKVEYTLFDEFGLPLRAKITANFEEFVEDTFSKITSMLSSPDLTHLHTVRRGEILPLLTERTYSNQRYYLQVARANRIKNFRKLPEGFELKFPPIV